MIRNSRRHRRSDLERLVNPAEVVERVPERHRGPVVLPFLTEGIRQSSTAADAHAQREI